MRREFVPETDIEESSITVLSINPASHVPVVNPSFCQSDRSIGDPASNDSKLVLLIISAMAEEIRHKKNIREKKCFMTIRFMVCLFSRKLNKKNL
jgi:hypothetical protein